MPAVIKENYQLTRIDKKCYQKILKLAGVCREGAMA